LVGAAIFRTLRRRGRLLDFLRDPLWGFVQVILAAAPFLHPLVKRALARRRRMASRRAATRKKRRKPGDR
jgi:hypothetical protein